MFVEEYLESDHDLVVSTLRFKIMVNQVQKQKVFHVTHGISNAIKSKFKSSMKVCFLFLFLAVQQIWMNQMYWKISSRYGVVLVSLK